MRVTLSSFLLAFGAAAAAPASAASLLNGSFENPQLAGDYAAVPGGSSAISDWLTVANGVEWFKPATYVSGVLGSAHDGTQVVDLATLDTSSGGLQQGLATVVNQEYAVTFYGGTSNGFGRLGDGTIDVSVGAGASPVSFSSIGTASLSNNAVPIAWQPYTYSFTATDTFTTIRFANSQDANTHFAFMDSASVAAVPEPHEWAMMLAGLGLVGWVARRRTRTATGAAFA